MSAPSPHRAVIIDLASRATGVMSRDVMDACGLNFRSAKQLVYRMADAGVLHRLPGKVKSFRFFASPELAAAYTPPKKKQRSRAKPAHLHKRGGRPAGVKETKPRAKPAPKLKPAKGLQDARVNAVSPHWRTFTPTPEPRITSETKVTICPAPRDRFEVLSAPRVVDSRECRTWAAVVAA